VRANSDDQLVIVEVPIGGRVEPLIRFFVASFSDGRLKRGRRVLELGDQDRHRAPLFLLLSRLFKIVVVRRSSYSDRRRASLFLFRSSPRAAVNDNVPNRNCMSVGNFLS
jgi:hypothetical protein